MARRITSFLVISLILAFLVIIGRWGLDQYNDIIGPGVPILLYHGVSSQEKPNKYVLSSEKFEEQLQWLKKNGYSTLLPRDIASIKWSINPDKVVIMTFDDGLENNFTTVLPLLRKYGYQAAFFVVTGAVGEKGIMTRDQLIELSLQGMELGSHTVTHRYLDTLDRHDLVFELKNSKLFLEHLTGEPVTSLAPPGGWYDLESQLVAQQEGYTGLFSCKIGLNDLTSKQFVYKRNEVLQGMSMEEFSALLDPGGNPLYKIKQALKFALHSLIGTENYVKLSHLI